MRCLRSSQTRPVDDPDDGVALHLPNRVDDRHDRDDAGSAGLERADHAREHIRRGEGTRRVVHEDVFDVAPQHGEACGYGCLPAGSAGDNGHEVAPVRRGLLGIRQRITLATGGRDDDDLHRWSLEDASKRMSQDGVIVEADEGLGDSGGEPATRARCDDDDRDAGDRNDAHGCHATARQHRLRRRGPRRAGRWPSLRRSSRPARARRSGSAWPWPASASHQPTGHDPDRGATGRGRPHSP